MPDIIQPDKLMAIVEGDEEFLEEMKVAQVQTLEELRESFATHLLGGNVEPLRAAHHKAKPAIELLGAEILTEKVQEAYQLIESNSDESTRNALIGNMNEITEQVMEATRNLSM